MRFSLRHMLAAGFLLAGFATAHAAPHKLLTPADLDKMRDVEDLSIAPKGDWVAYTVRSVNQDSDQFEQHLWMSKSDGTASIALTDKAGESESHPRFSPDGKWLAYLSSTKDPRDNAQLWLRDRRGGAAARVSDFKGEVIDFAWSPDGTKLVLVVADPDPGAPAPDAKVKTHKPIVIRRFRFMEDGRGYLSTQHDHLYLFDVASRKAEALTSGPYSEGLPAWSPDGKTIAFISKHHPNGDRDYNWQLLTIAAKPGAKPKLIADQAAGGIAAERPDTESGFYPAWSPDGRAIAFVHNGDPKLIEYATNHLAVVPAAGGTVRNLTPTLDRNVAMPRWSADGKAITALIGGDRVDYLAAIPASGGKPVRIAGGREDITAYSRAHGMTALLITRPTQPPEVFAFDGRHAPRQISHQNAWLKDYVLADAVPTSFKSKDGTEVHGFTMRAPGAPRGPLPAILRIHGGPQSQYHYEFEFEWQMLAAHGYQIIAANPRGSTGRGQAWCAAIFADWSGPAVPDVLAAVDDAVKRGLADPKRLGIGGWSYGGILTDYVIASDTRFKAATSGAGIANVLTGYGTDQYAYDYEAELGTPWGNTKVWEANSYPFLHAERITTPTLFMGGTRDMDVPLINGEQMYQALRSRNLDTELVVYPEQFHSFQTPSYRVDRFQRYLAWYDAHLGRPKTPH